MGGHLFQRHCPHGAGYTLSSHVKLQAEAALSICRAGPEQSVCVWGFCKDLRSKAGTKGGTTHPSSKPGCSVSLGIE